MTYKGPKSGALRLEIQRPLGNKRRGVILVVDDERPLLTALERQFKLAGYHPLTVTTIADAWKLLDSWVVHCVVADERIPDGSGAYFLIDVGRKFGGIGRILLSGFVEPLLLDLGQEHRFPVLDKACRFSELLRAVKNELGDA